MRFHPTCSRFQFVSGRSWSSLSSVAAIQGRLDGTPAALSRHRGNPYPVPLDLRTAGGRADPLPPPARSLGVYHAAAADEQRAAHLALAEEFTEEGEDERRAWHLAAAALTPNEPIAAELDQVAQRARERSGYAAAAAAFDRSARLTPDQDRRVLRLYAAAEAAWKAGYAAQASRLLEEALTGCENARVRADIQHLRGHILLRGGSPPEAHRLLVEEAEGVLDIDVEKAAFMLAEATEASSSWATSFRPPRPVPAPPRWHRPVPLREHTPTEYGGRW